jgi:hypothetical protein
MSRGWVRIAASTLVLLPALARAEAAGPSAEDVRVAGEEFDLGKRAYKQRNWIEAAEHFEKADSRAPSAVALEWAMRSRDKAAQLDRAAMLGALARSRHGDQVDLVKAADKILERARAALHQVTVHCTPACDIVVGTKLVHGAPATEHTIYLTPGGVALHASWPGNRTRSAPVQAIKGGSSELSFEAPEAATEAGPVPAPVGNDRPAATSEPETSRSKPGPTDRGTESHAGLPPVVFFVGAGLTAVAGGVTIWSGIDTKNNPGADTVRDKCAGQGTSCPEYQDGLSRQKRTNVLLGVTAGLAVTTGVIGAWFTDWSGPKKEAAGIEPWLGVGALGARGRF